MPDLTPKEVATILNVHVVTVYRLIEAGALVCYRLGMSGNASIRVRRDDLDKFRSAQVKPNSSNP